nr:N-acetylmuramoyl-L-alanine amidase [Lachnospiraceae bacterium]
GKGTEIGTYENTFTLSFNGTDAKESNYDVTYVYGTLKVTGSEVNPTVSSNTLGSVNKLAASVTKSGTISVSWKGVKTYYSKADKNTRDSKYKKTLYKVYRYNKKEGSWTDLTKTPITATKYTDSRAAGCDSLIYKVVPYGYDINAVSGNGAAAYIMAKPLMYQAQPNGNYDGIKVEFTNVGADSYTLVHYTNKKYPEEVNLISSALTLSANEQALTSYQYVDKGGSAVTITGSENYKTKYYFKVKANAYTFDDETLKVTVDETGYTSVVNAKLAGASTELVSVSSDYYNSVYVEWKKDSRVETDNKKDKYILYRSTSRAGKYSAVLTMQGNKINSALESGKLEYISANGSYKYHFTNLKPEVTYYYRIKVVDEGVSSGLSDYMSIRPVLDDIYKISVASKTTKSMQIQVGSISGADAYRVYYTKISDYDPDKNYTSDEIKALIGKVTPNYKKVKYSRNKTDWVDTLTVTGLTFGEYYGFYVEPMNSNHEHVTAEANRKYVAGMALIAAPTVTAKADSLTQISFTFTKVAGATGYYIQYSTDPSISQKNAADMEAYYVDKKTKKTIYNKRKVTIPNVTPGVPYYIRVTALRSGTKVETTNSHGIFGDDSDAVSVYGCPKAVKNLKATYPAAGGVSVNATIGFTHTTTGKSGSADLYGYKIDRVLYKYNTKTKKYDISENGITVYRDYMAGNVTSTSPSFTNTSAEAIPAGYLAEYTVYPVYYSTATGVVNNGYIIGNPKTVKYMNPTRISFGSSKYKLEVGGSKQTSLKFGSPASKSDSNVTNEEVYYELVNEGAYGDSPSTYVTVNSTGKLTAKKKTLAFNTKKNAIYLYARSKNDPNNVYARTKVIIEAKDEDDDDDDDNKSSDLKVMIDAGHGGSDSGATSNGVYEKALNLEYANGVKDYLKDYGATVYMTRTSDTYLSLVERTTLAKNKGCNLFVSIHMNSGGGSGTEVYYSVNSKYAKKTLASNISSSVASALGIGNRGAKTRTGDNGDYYAVIRNSASNGIPGLIVEHGFIDNSTDRSALQNKKDAACKAEAKAISNYWNK